MVIGESQIDSNKHFHMVQLLITPIKNQCLLLVSMMSWRIVVAIINSSHIYVITCEGDLFYYEFFTFG